jgi:site-specific recombinase XerD
VDELDARGEELVSNGLALSTNMAYHREWNEFCKFARELGAVELPASAKLVERFVAWLDLQGRGSGAALALAAIRHFHIRARVPDPSMDKRLQLVLEGARRKAAKGKRFRRRDPFPIEALRWHVEHRSTDQFWLRDAAVVALGLRSMRRASELGALRAEDVRFKDGKMEVLVRRSKTDQSGRGFTVFIEPSGSATCPVRLMQAYLKQRGCHGGFLFINRRGSPLSAGAISKICQRMVSRAGLNAQVSSHSLRIGGATAAMVGGLSKEQVMAIGGWTSDAVELYMRMNEPTLLGTTRRMGL